MSKDCSFFYWLKYKFEPDALVHLLCKLAHQLNSISKLKLYAVCDPLSRQIDTNIREVGLIRLLVLLTHLIGHLK